MNVEFRPIHQLVVDLSEGLFIVVRQTDLLPPFRGQMGSFGAFDEEAQSARLGVWADGGVSRVRKRTGLSVAKTRQVVFVSAKVLFFGVEPAKRKQKIFG